MNEFLIVGVWLLQTNKTTYYLICNSCQKALVVSSVGEFVDTRSSSAVTKSVGSFTVASVVI